MNGDDHELIPMAVGGDMRALSMLLERHGLAVLKKLSIGRKWRSVVDADDVMQVTYLEAFMRIGDFNPAGPGSFVSWLRRIADNNLRDAIRELERAKRPQPERRVTVPDDRSYVDLLEYLTGSTGSPSGAAAAREAAQYLETALGELPADYARVIRLYELEGRSIEEVAEAIGRSRGAVKMLLARARDRLKETLGSGSRFFSGSA